METEYLAFDNSSEREIIEKLCEVLPHIGVAIFPQTFIIETIASKGNIDNNLHLSDLSRFMVTSQDSESISESDFQSH